MILNIKQNVLFKEMAGLLWKKKKSFEVNV